MIRFRFRTLSSTYRNQLKNRAFSNQEIHHDFEKLKERYHKQRKKFISIIFICIGIVAVMMIATYQHYRRSGINDISMLIRIASSTVLCMVVALFASYYLAIAIVPLQFVKGIKRGYPESIKKYNMATFKKK